MLRRIISLDLKYEEVEEKARMIFCTDEELEKFYTGYGLIFFASKDDNIIDLHYIFNNPKLKNLSKKNDDDVEKIIDIIMNDYSNWRLPLHDRQDIKFWFGIYAFKNIIEPVNIDEPQGLIEALKRITVEIIK